MKRYSFKAMARMLGRSDNTIRSYAKRFAWIITEPHSQKAFEAYQFINEKRKLEISYADIEKDLVIFYSYEGSKNFSGKMDNEHDESNIDLIIPPQYLEKIVEGVLQNSLHSDTEHEDFINEIWKKILKDIEIVLKDNVSTVYKYVNDFLFKKVKLNMKTE